MASAALLFSFSAILFLFVLLQAPAAPGLAITDLLGSALHRFLDGQGLMELATRRNMILLCHAILLLILKDAGVLAHRRSRSPPGEPATATAIIVAQTAAPAPVPDRAHATRGAVVWRRRPQNRAAALNEHDAAATSHLVEWQPAAEEAATWAAPVLTTGPPAQTAEEAAAVAAKQIVIAESPRDDDDELLDCQDREAVVQPVDHPSAIVVDSYCDDYRRIVAVAENDKRVNTEGMEMELADDRMFEEFIRSQRRQMRQESLQLCRSGYNYQAIATCY